jgi:hypothetical protein
MTVYNVRRGDTLSELALRYHTTVSALAQKNHIANPDLILVGQKLQIDSFDPSPARRTASSPALTGWAPPPAPAGGVPGTTTGSVTSSGQTVPTTGIPNTENASQAKEYALYSQYVEKFGDAQAKEDLAAGRRVIVGLRQDTEFTSDQAYRGTYDDRMAVLWKDPDGTPHVREFAANTEPNRRWADDPSQRSKPVGRLVGDKTYHFQKSYKSSFGGNILSPDLRYGNPTIRRDTDRNHQIDSRDDVFSGDWGGQYVYFHRGATNDTYSAGCQTMDQGRFNEFWASLGGQDHFSYVLANVG